MYRIIFFGTSDFAVPALEHLAADARFEIVGVVTRPDRPVGRHATLTPPQVKIAAANHGILAIHQPEKLNDETFKSWIEKVGPECDAFVIVSYGKILPQWLLDLPKKGVVNLHGSLLPRWRGASPIQAAIAAGDKMTGVTIMKIDAEMDHGPILALSEEPILETDTGGSLHDRLAALGGTILPSILADDLDGSVEPQEQDHALATSCKILTRDDGRLDTSKTSQELVRLVRAYQPWPGTFIETDGKRLKIIEACIGADDASKRPGDRFTRDGRPCLACAGGTVLVLTTVQPEGKKEMSGAEYVRGRADRQ